MTIKSLWAALAATALLAACGGGGTSDESAAPAQASNEVPASATLSADAFTNYAGSLKASDTSEPLSLKKLKPPTSETEEPMPVI